MAVETQTQTPESAPAEKVVVAEAKAEETGAVKETPEPEEDPKKVVAEPIAVTEPEAVEEKKPSVEEEAASSFKEESNLVSDLADPEKKALDEFKQLVRAALANNEFNPPPPPPHPAKEEEPTKPEEPTTQAAAPAAEEPAAPPTESPVLPEAEQKTMVVAEDDGAKTVEAIAETVVPIAVTPPPPPPPPPTAAEEEHTTAPDEPTLPEEVHIWGVPLLGDERSDTILLKFLRARDFKVKEAMAMLKNTVLWRKEFGIEKLLEEDLGMAELEKVVFMHGFGQEGHPVCYNVYGVFQDKELYAKAFGDEEKCKRFLRWRIQFLEKGIRGLLDFSPGGLSTMVQVTDLRNSPGPGKKELRQATNQALSLLQDNYPEFAAKQIFINVPWWYLAFNRMISPFLTQRTKSKFIFAGPSKSTETLFKNIAPEQVPIQYGGLSKENDPDFSMDDATTEIMIKPSGKETVEIAVTEACLLVWEFRVLGWEVSYVAEFVPSSEGGYTVIVQKPRKLVATDEPLVKNSFKIGEPGKVVLTIENTTSKRKKLLFRYKTKSSTNSTGCC